MRYAGKALAILLYCCLWQNTAFAAETVSPPDENATCTELALSEFWKKFKVSGWLEAMQSMRVHSLHDAITSRLRMRLKVAADMGWLYGFASADAEKNWKIDYETGVKAHELWLEHADANWDIRVGRQIIIWGKADGVQVTDIICPPDYTESITRDLDEIRQPVEAAKFRFLGNFLNLELIWIPVFREAKMPRKGTPWSITQAPPAGVPMNTADTREPDVSLKNSEIAMKMSGYFSGLDVAASVFYTWDDIPASHRTVSYASGTPSIIVSPKHHRMTVLGLEFSRPWSDFVFRGEAAYYVGRYRETTMLDRNPLPRDSLKWLLGLDWTPGDDWSVSAQIVNENIFGHESYLIAEKDDALVTLNISKKLLNQILTLSNMIYCDVNDGEFYNRSKVEYEVSDGFFVSAGLDIFSGNDGQFGVYRDNTQFWFRMKYSF